MAPLSSASPRLRVPPFQSAVPAGHGVHRSISMRGRPLVAAHRQGYSAYLRLRVNQLLSPTAPIFSPPMPNKE